MNRIKAFIVLHKLKQKLKAQEAGDWTKIQKLLVEYTADYFEKLFAICRAVERVKAKDNGIPKKVSCESSGDDVLTKLRKKCF